MKRVLIPLAIMLAAFAALVVAGFMPALQQFVTHADQALPLLMLANAPVALSDLKRYLEDSTEEIKERQQRHMDEVTALREHIAELERKLNRQGLGGDGSFTSHGSEKEREQLNLGMRALLAGDQARAVHHFVEAKAMSVGSDPDGGYLVTPHLSNDMTRVMAETAPFIGLARTVEIDSGDAFEEPVDTEEVGAEWVGERQERSDTDTPQLKMFRCPVHELQAQPAITQKLIDTSGRDVIGWLRTKIGEKFGLSESAAFHSGDGVLRPRGFLDYPTAATRDATRPWWTLEHAVSGSASDITPDALINLKATLKAQYRTGAVWLMNRGTAANVSRMKDNENRYLWSNGLTDGQPDVLLGHRVVIDEQMPDVAAGTLPIAFGNLAKGYTIVRRLGVRFLVDPFTSKPNIKLYAFQRVGGGVNNSEAIKLLKVSA